MKKLIVFESRPDYVFGDDERGNTWLVWPESYTFTEEEDGFDGEPESCFHVREQAESGEYFDYLVFNQPIPETWEELEEIFRTADGDEIKAV